MAGEYLCVTAPLSGLDDSAQRPGALMTLLKGVFPALSVRGGVSEDGGVQWMLRGAPEAAAASAARALSGMGGGRARPALGHRGPGGAEADRRDWTPSGSATAPFSRSALALRHGESADRLNPATARALYGELRRQSITRLERYAQCPFAYFTQYGLRPERIEPFQLNVRDEGTFFHSAVHEFLLASMEDLNRLDDGEAGRRMDGIADRLLDAMASDGPLGDSAVALAERGA